MPRYLRLTYLDGFRREAYFREEEGEGSYQPQSPQQQQSRQVPAAREVKADGNVFWMPRPE